MSEGPQFITPEPILVPADTSTFLEQRPSSTVLSPSHQSRENGTPPAGVVAELLPRRGGVPKTSSSDWDVPSDGIVDGLDEKARRKQRKKLQNDLLNGPTPADDGELESLQPRVRAHKKSSADEFSDAITQPDEPQAAVSANGQHDVPASTEDARDGTAGGNCAPVIRRRSGIAVTDEQVWREFVLEENYSVLATRGILQRILEFNSNNKSLQILKMQNAALAEIDRQFAKIHGMDQTEVKGKTKSVRRITSKKVGSSPPGSDDSSDTGIGDVSVVVDDIDSEPRHGSVSSTPDRQDILEFSDDDFDDASSGSSTGWDPARSTTKSKSKNKTPPKLKNFFKSEFLVKMKNQMKRHMNELWKRDYPRIRFSGRCHVNFLHGEVLSRKTEYENEITLQNVGVRTAHINLQHFGTSPKGSVFDLTAEPQSCEIPKGKKQVIKFKLVLHSSRAEVSEVVGVDVGWREGSKEAKMKDKDSLRFPRRLCIYVSAVGEAAVFGVPLSQLEMVQWEPQDTPTATALCLSGGLVPKVLVDLKSNLLRTGGLQQEGIFRKAPGDTETQEAKRALNSGTFKPEMFGQNPQLYAHLIKLWFRELPEPVLEHANPEKLIACKELPAATRIVEVLPKHLRALFDWLLELMAEVVDHAEANFMNPANCGIVMGPNLLPNVDATNPMQALMLNKACTTFLTVLLKAGRSEEVFVSPT